MLKLLVAVLVAAAVAAFAMDNLHRVEFGLIVGRPTHVRLFFLLLTSYLLGCFTTMIVNIYIGMKAKKKEKAGHAADKDGFFVEEER